MPRYKSIKFEASYDPPPYAPDNSMNWSATDSNYEPGDAIGRGPGPREALLDLIEQLDMDENYWKDYA